MAFHPKPIFTAIASLGALTLAGTSVLAGPSTQAPAARTDIQLAHMHDGASGTTDGMAGRHGHGSASAQGMNPRHTGSGMMGSGMMGQSEMGSGMMGSGMMGHGSGKNLWLGNRVIPTKDLVADDVRHFLEHRLEAQGNKRLKVGEITETDKDTIMAEIVTLDGSLVERFTINRHSGSMQTGE